MKITLSPFLSQLGFFWYSTPALLYGTSFLLGLFAVFDLHPLLILPLTILWIPFIVHYKKFWHSLTLSFLIFLTAIIYAGSFYSFPKLPSEGIKGKGLIKIKNISLQKTTFGSQWIYRCELMQFITENEFPPFSSLSCIISFSSEYPRPNASQNYRVFGKLIQKESGYHFKISKNEVWEPIENTYSFAETRAKLKTVARESIESHFFLPLSGTFLSGLVTGEFDDIWIRHQFSRFGLQHLLAISGFHFAIVASFLSFIFSFLMKQKLKVYCLIILLGIYCLFLGPQPSILRAWIMCTVALTAGLMNKQASALNSLGLALLLILGYDPLLYKELGFQLSFLTTAAILLFYQSSLSFLNELLPKRELKEVIQMNFLQQHGYCLLTFLRQGLALTIAVNIFALPITLFLFQKFPWMSLLYNLFYPFLASGSLCLLLLGMMFSFIPFLSTFLHFINDYYTYFLLQLTYQIPQNSDLYMRIESLHPEILIVYLTLTFLLGIYLKTQNPQKNFEFI